MNYFNELYCKKKCGNLIYHNVLNKICQKNNICIILAYKKIYITCFFVFAFASRS